MSYDFNMYFYKNKIYAYINIIDRIRYMIYFCELCNFKTERSYDMKVHKLCTKHLKNVGLATKQNLNEENLDNGEKNIHMFVERCSAYNTNNHIKCDDTEEKQEHTKEKKPMKIYSCPHCQNILSCGKSLWRHKKTCKFNGNNNDGKIVVSANEFNELKKKFEEMSGLTQKVEKLTSVVEKSLTQQKKPTKIKIKEAPLTININSNNTTNNMDNSVKNISNVMKYINQTYNLAEPLTMLPPSEAKKMLENTKTKKYSAEDFIVYYYDKHLFDQFIGDVILRVYKKANPDEQQIWASDVERLSFIIRRALEEGGRLWMKDVQGVTITQYIIDPILGEVKSMIKEHNQNCIEAMHSGYKSLDELEKLSNAVYNCAKILRDIDDKVLEEDILRYIIPKFQVAS